MNSLQLMGSTDAFCTLNRLGAQSFTAIALTQFNSSLSASIATGTATEIFTFMGLTDLTGVTAQPSFQLGMVGGTPVAGSGYSGSADLDWWYTVDPTTVDGSRLPKAQVSASITSGGVFNAGPGTINFPNLFSSGPATLPLANATLSALMGPPSTPTASAFGLPPGHLPSEHLDPTLKSFASLAPDGKGRLCGAATGATLASIPVPSALLSGTSACLAVAGSAVYTANNSMLDVLVTGCKAVVGLVTVVNALQPDTVDPNAPVVGAGPPYKLFTGAGNVVAACADKNGTPVSLSSCLAAAAYSSYFQFTTDRVIVK